MARHMSSTLVWAFLAAVCEAQLVTPPPLPTMAPLPTAPPPFAAPQVVADDDADESKRVALEGMRAKMVAGAKKSEVAIGLVAMILAVLLLYYIHIKWSRFQKEAEKATGVLSTTDGYAATLVKMFNPSQEVVKYQFRGIKPPKSTIDVQFKELGLELPDGRSVLKDVTGEFRAGRMAAIMGPSGAGKTTFMNVLCGKASYGNMMGERLINGHDVDIKEINSVMGFVPQDDVVHQTLTVREQIRFSAELRNSVKTSSRQVNNIVLDVLNVMQLIQIQNSVVGSVEERGISGGQRKRVNIGLELAAQPTLLFLDEPTSGLDSTSSLAVVYSLKKMCQLGMTCIMVIHQPRYSLFTLFDDVLLLGKGGQAVYLGPSLGAKKYFEDLGFQMTDGENRADFFMDVISGEVANPREADFKPAKLAEKWKKYSADRDDEEAAASPLQASPKDSEFGERPALRRLESGRSFSADEETAVLMRNLEDKWDKFDTNKDGLLDASELQELLTMEMNDQRVEPSDEVCEELLARMAGEGATMVTKAEFLKYLTDMKDQVAHDPRDEGDIEAAGGLGRWHSSSAGGSMKGMVAGVLQNRDFSLEESTDSSASDDSSDEEEGPLKRSKLRKLQRITPGYNAQFRIIAMRTVIQWWRQNKFRAIYFIAMGAGAMVLAVQDAVTEVPKWDAQNYVNSHTCVGLLTAIFCLNCFGEDQPIFWRERNRGLNVLSFFQARVFLNSIDLVMQTYLFCAIYFLMRDIQVRFFLFWLPFLLVAFAASGWGYLISTILAPQHGPFVVSLISFVICGLLGNPMNLAKFLDNTYLNFMVSYTSITRWSIPMSFAIQVEAMPDLELHGQQENMLFPFYNDTLHGRGFAGMDDWWSGVWALVIMGVVLRSLAYFGLAFGNRKQMV